MNDWMWVVVVVFINGIGFGLMGSDKQRAMHHQWRISEQTFLTIALFGGSIGILVGMFVFHHKTNKALFYIGIPLIIGFQSVLILQLF